MDFEVIGLLEDLGYERKLDAITLHQLLEDWTEYSKALAWASTELQVVTQIDETVNALGAGDDVYVVQFELSSLLNELQCPYSLIMNSTDAKSRFDTPDKRLLALYFLLTELSSSRILYFEKPQQMEIEIEESSGARLMKEISIDVGLGPPPANLAIRAIWAEIKKRLASAQSKLKESGVEMDPIFNGTLSPSQWTELEQLHTQFDTEYEIRREMLLKRIDVTIQSFHWSDRLTKQRDAMSAVFHEHRRTLVPKPSVSLSDILAARKDLAIIEKTSCASVRKHTKSAINSVTIGMVPDRGGRPSEACAPQREMPSWQQRQAGPSGSVGWTKSAAGSRGGGYRGRGRGGGGDRGRGDSHQGGFNEYSGGGSYGPPNAGYHQQAHYSSNEGWNQHGGRGGDFQNTGQYEQYYDPNQQGNYQPRGGGRGGKRSKVQGGWNNN